MILVKETKVEILMIIFLSFDKLLEISKENLERKQWKFNGVFRIWQTYGDI